MEKLSMCRICLVEDVGMQSIGTKYLHQMYEALTMMPFETEDLRPIHVCYICCARLQNCYKLRKRCLQSEEMFTQMLSNKMLKLQESSRQQTLRIDRVIQISLGGVLPPSTECVQVKTKCEVSEEDVLKEENNGTSEWDVLIIKDEPDVEDLDNETLKQDDRISEWEVPLHNIGEEPDVTDAGHPVPGTLRSNLQQDYEDITTSYPTASINTGENLYQCIVCKNCFSNNNDFKNHVRLHNADSPYQCSICEKLFSNNSVFRNHIRTHTGEKLFHCNVCNKCFNNNTCFKRHSRIHTGEKPYECNECKKCFSQKVHFDSHVRTHTGDKPYQCKICDKCFSSRSSFKRHSKIHTGEKPYTCHICDKGFMEKFALNKHIRTHNITTKMIGGGEVL